MNDFNVFSLGDYKFRKLNLTVAPVILGVDILIRIFHLSYLWKGVLNVHVLLHFFFLIALISVVMSKEKTDDELA
jgi:hypothetical protein